MGATVQGMCISLYHASRVSLVWLYQVPSQSPDQASSPVKMPSWIELLELTVKS